MCVGRSSLSDLSHLHTHPALYQVTFKSLPSLHILSSLNNNTFTSLFIFFSLISISLLVIINISFSFFYSIFSPTFLHPYPHFIFISVFKFPSFHHQYHSSSILFYYPFFYIVFSLTFLYPYVYSIFRSLIFHLFLCLIHLFFINFLSSLSSSSISYSFFSSSFPTSSHLLLPLHPSYFLSSSFTTSSFLFILILLHPHITHSLPNLSIILTSAFYPPSFLSIYSLLFFTPYLFYLIYILQASPLPIPPFHPHPSHLFPIL